jgi:hypothetical protein
LTTGKHQVKDFHPTQERSIDHHPTIRHQVI